MSGEDIRYVVVALSLTKRSEYPKYTQLFQELDKLIVGNNRTPSPVVNIAGLAMFAVNAETASFSSMSIRSNAPALAYYRMHRARFLAELKDCIRFASVSAQPEHADDLKRCAEWLAEHLRWIGMERVTVVPTGGHPIVYAECCEVPGLPPV
jgi:hypothetical protein